MLGDERRIRAAATTVASTQKKINIEEKLQERVRGLDETDRLFIIPFW
jgi:tRNA (Thr-GGU) A37 N-methylase